MTSATDIVEWGDGRHWYELTAEGLCVYAEDVSGADAETRRLFTTHACFALSDLQQAVGYPFRYRIDLEWALPLWQRLAVRLLRVPRAPTTLRLADARDYRRVADALAADAENE